MKAIFLASGFTAFFSGDFGPSLVVEDFSIRWVCLILNCGFQAFLQVCSVFPSFTLHLVSPVSELCLSVSSFWEQGFKLVQLFSGLAYSGGSWPMDMAFAR